MACAVLLLSVAAAATRSAAGPLEEAQQALRERDFVRAVELATQAVAAAPDESRPLLIRGVAHESLRDFPAAAADFGRVVALDPESPELLRRCGAARYRAGDVAGAVADWDREIALAPAALPDHWMRGIGLYELGRFDDGAAQFSAYQKVDGNDVENAVWHFLCRARAVGVEQARSDLLPIQRDRRVPMMEVYRLFRGELQPDDVLAAAEAVAEPEAARRQALFFAHLYLGLYAEAQGDAQRSLAHLRQAANDFFLPNYMGDVARVHLAQQTAAAAQPSAP